MFFDSGKGRGIGPIAEFRLAAYFAHRDAQDLRDVLARTYLSHAFGEAFAAIAFTFGARLLRAPQLAWSSSKARRFS